MDLSKLKTSDWLLVGGGLGFLVFGTFLKWIRISIEGFGASGGNAFDFFFTGTIPWILIVGSGVLALLLASGVLRASSAPWTVIMLGATAVGTFLILIRLLFPGLGEDIPDEIDVSRSGGLWLSSLAAIVALVGAVMKFRESGGNLRDLTDVDRLRDSFDRPGDGSPPPPPPPPVPPPPPAAEPPLPPPPPQ